MIEALKFVQGAVARKDFVQALTHFRIENGVIKGFNGAIAIASPIALELTTTPKAVPFFKAIQACRETTQLHMTANGKLSIKSGKFRAFIECTEEVFPSVEPDGEIIPLDKGILPALTSLKPFIAEDASRPWARGILFSGQSAFATNNIILVEHWLGYPFPTEVNIPKPAIDEILRIKEEPEKLQIAENSITFHYPSGRWLRTNTYSTEWPPLSKVLDQPSNPQPFPEGFFSDLNDLLPFADELNRIYFMDNKISTSSIDSSGAFIENSSLPYQGIYNINQLMLLEKIATSIDFSRHPKAALFFGKNIRGAIIGMKG